MIRAADQLRCRPHHVLQRLLHLAHWSDSCPASAKDAIACSIHPRVVIDGLGCEPAALPSAAECTALSQAQVLMLMNDLNELMQIADSTLEASLAARLAALTSDEFLTIAHEG